MHAILAVLTAALVAPAAPSQAADGIVRPAAAEGPLPASPAAIRQATVHIDVDALQALDPATGGTLTLNLFPDAVFVCDFHTFEHHVNGADTWVGRVRGDEQGWLVAGLAEGQAVVNVWTGDGRAFEIRPAGEQGPYIVREIDLHLLGSCGGEEPAGPDLHHGHAEPLGGGVGGNQRGGSRGCQDDGSVIDVMIVWTPVARAQAGGTGAITALAALCVVQTNMAYINSQINTSLRLAHAAEVFYLEDPLNMSQDLHRLQNPSDGFIDGVHQLRDTYKADLVAMLVHSLDPDTAGIGYIMLNLSPSFANFAFSVTDHANAITGLTFAHELGHNLGCAHDPDNSNGGLYPYSFGHRFFGFDFGFKLHRTVMAYAPGSRVPHFSNPFVLYQGVFPTGTANANNAMTINNTAATAANFRSSGNCAPTARCSADFDSSGALTLADFVNFRNAYTSGDMAADFNGDGALTLSDFVAFRNAFTAGCP